MRLVADPLYLYINHFFVNRYKLIPKLLKNIQFNCICVDYCRRYSFTYADNIYTKNSVHTFSYMMKTLTKDYEPCYQLYIKLLNLVIINNGPPYLSL